MTSAGEAAPAGFQGEVLRPQDAGYDEATACAAEQDLRIPMADPAIGGGGEDR